MVNQEAKFSLEALGAVIRSQREKGRPKLTQRQLGEAAGYGIGAGAGVTVSRIEVGQMMPGEERLIGIAQALGMTAEELMRKAEHQTAADARSGDGHPGPKPSVRDRLTMVQEAVDERTKTLQRVSGRFNDAHERAMEEFFLRFVGEANAIVGAQQAPEPSALGHDEEGDPVAEARHRVQIGSSVVGQGLGAVGGAAAGSAVGGATAYATFMAAASFGTASTGAAISGLSGIAATNATLALLGGGALATGGGGMAAGTLLLGGLVAAPAALAAVGGIIWMRRRSKKQEAELGERLDEAEWQLEKTETGFRRLVEILESSAEVLSYIATHGGHAVQRWGMGLGERPLEWNAMTSDQQASYDDFLKIAGAQLAVATIAPQAFLTLEGDELSDLIEQTQQVVKFAGETVTERI